MVHSFHKSWHTAVIYIHIGTCIDSTAISDISPVCMWYQCHGRLCEADRIGPKMQDSQAGLNKKPPKNGFVAGSTRYNN